jgi:hypothetical protein
VEAAGVRAAINRSHEKSELERKEQLHNDVVAEMASKETDMTVPASVALSGHQHKFLPLDIQLFVPTAPALLGLTSCQLMKHKHKRTFFF